MTEEYWTKNHVRHMFLFNLKIARDNVMVWKKNKAKIDTDCCKWKRKANYFVTKCNNETDVMYGMKENYKFCPYCGKKLKVVG